MQLLKLCTTHWTKKSNSIYSHLGNFQANQKNDSNGKIWVNNWRGWWNKSFVINLTLKYNKNNLLIVQNQMVDFTLVQLHQTTISKLPCSSNQLVIFFQNKNITNDKEWTTSKLMFPVVWPAVEIELNIFWVLI